MINWKKVIRSPLVKNINSFWANSVLQSNPAQDEKTPITIMLKENGVDASKFVSFIRDNGSLLEWMVDCQANEKMRGKHYPKISKESAFYEGRSCLTDVMRKIIAEDDFLRKKEFVRNVK